jgi:hypothetical protein
MLLEFQPHLVQELLHLSPAAVTHEHELAGCNTAIFGSHLRDGAMQRPIGWSFRGHVADLAYGAPASEQP